MLLIVVGFIIIPTATDYVLEVDCCYGTDKLLRKDDWYFFITVIRGPIRTSFLFSSSFVPFSVFVAPSIECFFNTDGGMYGDTYINIPLM